LQIQSCKEQGGLVKLLKGNASAGGSSSSREGSISPEARIILALRLRPFELAEPHPYWGRGANIQVEFRLGNCLMVAAVLPASDLLPGLKNQTG